jgi:hypothetical protein
MNALQHTAYILILSALIMGCKTKKEITSDIVHDSIYVWKERVKIDTVFQHDSISVDYKQGIWRIDTLPYRQEKTIVLTKTDTITKMQYVDKWHVKYISNNDSTKQTSISNKMTKKTGYNKFVVMLAWCGGIFLLLIGGYITYKTTAIIRKVC